MLLGEWFRRFEGATRSSETRRTQELHPIQRGTEVASLLAFGLYYDQHSRAIFPRLLMTVAASIKTNVHKFLTSDRHGD